MGGARGACEPSARPWPHERTLCRRPLPKETEPNLQEFASLGLAEPLARAVAACGYSTPTPVQAQTIPPLLEGRDVLGCAQTGTGKTAAFALPVLQQLAADPHRGGGRRPIRALILTPTRELAAQIGASIETYGGCLPLRHDVIFGGVGQAPQVRALRRGIDILVACPGRLLDLQGQGLIDLSQVEHFVLDEADRMLDMGFIHDVRRVLRLLPKQRQNLLFSATMPRAIVELAGSFLHDPVQVEVTPETVTVDLIEQRVMFVPQADKRRLLAHILHLEDIAQALVFTRTKHGANRLVKQLDREGITAQAIHGNKSQTARTRALDAFRSGELGVLVATDVASRGIDVDGVSHVFNFDLPNEPESYVHRIGRTGRAGRSGRAVAFCDPTEGEQLRAIERLIGFSIPVDDDHRWHAPAAVPARPEPRPQRRRTPRGSSGAGPHRRRRGGR
jgi:ATP-dependent RNA helicase RhlE